MSSIIILNGASFSGKKALAQAFQSIVADPWLHFSPEILAEMLPETYRAEQEHFLSFRHERAFVGDFSSLAYTEQFISQAPIVAHLFANRGDNIIIDECFIGDHLCKTLP